MAELSREPRADLLPVRPRLPVWRLYPQPVTGVKTLDDVSGAWAALNALPFVVVDIALTAGARAGRPSWHRALRAVRVDPSAWQARDARPVRRRPAAQDGSGPDLSR